MSKQIKIGEKGIITLDVNTINPNKYWFLDPEIITQFESLRSKDREWQLKREILIQKTITE